mgnify:CR=1 FL=1
MTKLINLTDKEPKKFKRAEFFYHLSCGMGGTWCKTEGKPEEFDVLILTPVIRMVKGEEYQLMIGYNDEDPDCGGVYLGFFNDGI